jgi:hypothetical protein
MRLLQKYFYWYLSEIISNFQFYRANKQLLRHSRKRKTQQIKGRTQIYIVNFMKKSILFLFLLLNTFHLFPQEITKGDILNLFHKAQKAEKANNTQEALDIYKTILSVDPDLPTPYLKMANIYATDENNEKSIAAAITLYNQYLNLESNDENTSVIKNRVMHLQKYVDNEQNVNLAEILYINQEQAQNVIVTKARRGIRAATKEEMEQEVEEVSTLYDRAQEAINDNNIQAGTTYLEQLTENSELASPVNAQAYSLLANSYLNQGDWGKMEDVLSELQNNIDANKNLLEYYGYKIKESIPFEDDICGIWVSDLSVDKNSLPYFALKIEKNQDDKYEATLLPYCTFAKESNMYQGKPFEYKKIISNAKTVDYFANSYSNTIIPEENIISFNFGNEKFRKGMSAAAAQFGMEVVGRMGQSTVDYFASNTSKTSSEVELTIGVVKLITAGIQGLIYMSTTSKKTANLVTTDINRIFAGCADLNLIQTKMVEKSTGYEKESADTTQMKIYKLYPEYNILFADKDGELFGNQTYSKSEILQLEEYTYIQALKDKGYYNRQSYKKLSQKINNYCWSKVESNPEMKIIAYFTAESFKYATKGLSYKKFQNKNGYFEGWTNMSNKIDGWGICRFNNGDEYVGNWNNNNYSGNGKFTKKDKNGIFLLEYTGIFEKNKLGGKGVIKTTEYIYEGDFKNEKINGKGKMMILSTSEEYDGTFRNNIFREGSGSYDGGIFTGKWKQIKKDNKKMFVPDGEGTMTTANGETFFGKWRNGVYQNKKETVRK